MPNTCYLEPTESAGRPFVVRGLTGNVATLNLLRFRDITHDSATPELTPSLPISG